MAVGVVAGAGRASAESISLGFDVIPETSSSAAAAVESQLRVEISDNGVGPNQAMFTFTNVGSIASSITDIYFQDGTLLALAQIINQPSSGGTAYLTNFSGGASPGSLPGGMNLNPVFSPTVGVNFFALDSNSPTQPMGINPGERLSVLFNLQSNLGFADVLRALVTTPPSTVENPSLRIGIHVQGMGPTGVSASYVNERPGGGGGGSPPTAVPLPATVWAGLALMGGVGLKRLSRRKAAAV